MLEVLVALSLVSLVLLAMLASTAAVPGTRALDRLQRAGNLARSQVELHRSLPLTDPAWNAGVRIDNDIDPAFELMLQVTVSGDRRDLLVRVTDRGKQQPLVSASLTRTEGGL